MNERRNGLDGLSRITNYTTNTIPRIHMDSVKIQEQRADSAGPLIGRATLLLTTETGSSITHRSSIHHHSLANHERPDPGT